MGKGTINMPLHPVQGHRSALPLKPGALKRSTHKHLGKLQTNPLLPLIAYTVDSFPALLACGVLFEDLAAGGGSSFRYRQFTIWRLFGLQLPVNHPVKFR